MKLCCLLLIKDTCLERTKYVTTVNCEKHVNYLCIRNHHILTFFSYLFHQDVVKLVFRHACFLWKIHISHSQRGCQDIGCTHSHTILCHLGLTKMANLDPCTFEQICKTYVLYALITSGYVEQACLDLSTCLPKIHYEHPVLGPSCNSPGVF